MAQSYLQGKGKGKATIYIYTRFVFKATSLWGRVYEIINTNRTEISVKNPNWWEADQLAIYKAWRS